MDIHDIAHALIDAGATFRLDDTSRLCLGVTSLPEALTKAVSEHKAELVALVEARDALRVRCEKGAAWCWSYEEKGWLDDADYQRQVARFAALLTDYERACQTVPEPVTVAEVVTEQLGLAAVS